MGGLTADREFSLEVAIERNAVLQEIVNACAGFARDAERYLLIDQACADRDGVLSAQNSPARPPPTMTTSSVLRVRSV